MCGRYSLHANPNVVALQFGLAYPPAISARYNIAPGTEILAVRAGPKSARGGDLLHWGLIPSWAKDATIGQRLNNARADTLSEKPSFRAAFRRRRCIIPANGFYEWMPTGDRKQPYYIRPVGDELFGFAGLYEHWQGPNGPINSCAMITTEANELIRPIHDRMPVILPVEAYAHWLDPDNPDPAALQSMLKPAPPERMTATPVSFRVNSVRNDDATLLEPVTQEKLL